MKGKTKLDNAVSSKVITILHAVFTPEIKEV